MKLVLNLAAVLLMAAAAAPASAQRGGLGDGGRIGGSLRGSVDSGRVISREAMRPERGDAHQARRRWNAANDDSGTRIRRHPHQARRRWNAANGNDR